MANNLADYETVKAISQMITWSQMHTTVAVEQFDAFLIQTFIYEALVHQTLTTVLIIVHFTAKIQEKIFKI